MTTATSSTLFDTGKAAMDLARRCTLKLVDGIPRDKLCHQPVPNANHALWVLGHLACSDDFFASHLGDHESSIDEKWADWILAQPRAVQHWQAGIRTARKGGMCVEGVERGDVEI